MVRISASCASASRSPARSAVKNRLRSEPVEIIWPAAQAADGSMSVTSRHGAPADSWW
ncbi:hypothetical protein SAVIM40S_03380 [Streptomyces avidinii]